VNAEASVFAILALVSFSLLIVSTRSFVIDFKSAGLTLFSGLRGGIHQGISLASRTVLSVRELAELRREYAELSRRVARYEQIERRDAEILQENRRLREQLGFTQTLGYRRVNAEITGRDPANLFSALVINKGKHSGVAANMPVIAWQNGTQALVGKVIQAGQFESLVMPLYDVNSSISARLAESRYEGLVEGQGSPESPLLMRFVRKQARDEINYGDVVVSSGLGGVYPPGITLGRVNRIISRDYEISMELELEGTADFSRLEYVVVIDPASGREDG
jgi:rod shape-determining protein MreC